MARLVVDTNSLLQCISRRSRYHGAVAANAKFVVTDDGHFDILKQVDFPRIEIIGLDDIIKII